MRAIVIINLQCLLLEAGRGGAAGRGGGRRRGGEGGRRGGEGGRQGGGGSGDNEEDGS